MKRGIMFYKDILEELLKKEKNPVNSMYLHEIGLKWKNFEKAAAEKKGSNENLVNALNKFIKAISNRKFKFNAVSEKGFKEDSDVFSNYYLNDLISILMNRRKILSHLGIKWGFQAFDTNLKFNPVSLSSFEKDLNFEQSSSPQLLQLSQEFDFQYRVSGKRSFKKYKTVFPLIVFHTFTNLTETNFIHTEYYANMAKTTFDKSKTIIVTETLEEGFSPDIKSSRIDSICVLRKQYISVNKDTFNLDAVDALELKIKQLLTEENGIIADFTKTGIIT